MHSSSYDGSKLDGAANVVLFDSHKSRISVGMNEIYIL